MASLSRTWWGQRFIRALESFTDTGRLQRGRGYAGPNRITAFEIKGGVVEAKVRGNVNPYFGVYKEPTYKIQVALLPFSNKNWQQALKYIGNRAGFVSRLLMQEMPDDIEQAFAENNLHLLPVSRRDFKTRQCSCPDIANPCKHIAGVYYHLAELLDSDPFLLFELRGLSRQDLQAELEKFPLGKILVASLIPDDDGAPLSAESYYTPAMPAELPKNMDYQAFWQGGKRLPEHLEPATPAAIPALLIKKAGDNPPFWHRDKSFIEVMEEFYPRVRNKNPGL